MKSISLVVAILLTTLISGTIEAKVVDPEETPELQLLLKDTDWIHWLLIEEKTFRAMDLDARGHDEAVRVLEEAQVELEESVDMFNALQVVTNGYARDVNQLKREKFALENPPWYRQPAVWGATGLAAGVGLTLLALGFGGAF